MKRKWSPLKSSHIGFYIFLTCFQFTMIAHSETSKLESAKVELEQKNYKKAHRLLNSIPLAELDPKRMALVEFFRGQIFFEENKYQLAIQHYEKSIQLGTRLSDVAYHSLGLAYSQIPDKKKALFYLEKLEEVPTSDHLREKSRLYRAEILLGLNQNNEARTLYKKLEKKMRRSEHYPEILWALLRIDLSAQKRLDACYWGRILYQDYPTYPPVASWGLTWSENRVGDVKMDCKDSFDDQKKRIKRLQWMGASEKAHEELKAFDKQKVDPFVKDLVNAEYLVNEGYVKEAFVKLKKYYKDPQKKKDEDWIGLIAKSAARAGDADTAIGIYDQSAQQFSGGKSQYYLFQAAHHCYQSQDYDGAIRRFEKIKKIAPFTSFAKQANWYIPWSYYLKGQYERSYQYLSKIQKKHRSLPSFVSPEKVKYWMAMSLKKSGKLEEAKKLFLEISHDQYIGYYSIAAVHRLREIIGTRGLASLDLKSSFNLHENWLPHLRNPEINLVVDLENQTTVAKLNEAYYTEWEDLPFMQEYLNMDKPTQIYTAMTEPQFREHVERARELSMVGLSELAKWELYSVEGRTKDEGYLKTLMFEYHRNQIFHRSTYIGTTRFGKARSHLGLQLGASLWHFVYPRAFETDVVKMSQKIHVPAEFIWSIMKAETNFRPDALSPVGARGLMQVMAHTGRKVASLAGQELEPEELFTPHVGIEIGTRYLQRVLSKFDNKIPLAAAAYNGGPHRVHLWLQQFGDLDMDEFIEHIPFLETRNYVKKVTQYYTLYNLLYNKNADASVWLSEAVRVYPEGPAPTRETWEEL